MAVAFVPSKVSFKTRIMIGVLHASIHLASALILMLVFEVGIEFLARQKLVETSGQFSFSLSICVTFNECFLDSNCYKVYGNSIFKLFYIVMKLHISVVEKLQLVLNIACILAYIASIILLRFVLELAFAFLLVTFG